jgi:hypothetical protein
LEKKGGLQERQQATHFIAGVGKEVVKFDPSVRVQGKAEAYLLALLKAQIYTLSRNLAASILTYPQLSRTDWVMQKDMKGKVLTASYDDTGISPRAIALIVCLAFFFHPRIFLGESVDPAQIILLVAQIDFVRLV